MLVTKRKADIRVIKGGKLDPKPVKGGPTGYFTGTSGLPGAVHGYMDSRCIRSSRRTTHVLELHEARRTTRTSSAVARMHWTGTALTR